MIEKNKNGLFKKLVILSAILCLPIKILTAQQPDITSVDYGITLEHGKLLTIKGQSFGIKDPAEPLVWDDLEDGKCDNKSTIGNWMGFSGADGTNNLNINSNNQRSGKSTYNASGNFGPSNNYLCFTKRDILHDKYFVSFWFKLSNNFVWNYSNSGAANNIKHWRVFVPGSSVTPNTGASKHAFTYHGFEKAGSSGCDNASVWNPSWNETRYWIGDLKNIVTAGTWHLNQYIWKEGSDVYVPDGVMIYIFNGDTAKAHINIPTYGDDPDSRYKYLIHIGWYDSWGGGIPYDYFVYMDDVYVDTTWARIEIGESIFYHECKHREIQISEEWTDQEIEIKFNLGSFEKSDSIYLFVINKEGRASNGYPLFKQAGKPNTPTWYPDADSNPQAIPDSDNNK